MKYLYAIILLSFPISISAQFGFSDEAKAKIVFLDYNPDRDSVINAGILVTLDKDWHIYWRNSGDSGIPTLFEFNLPPDYKVTEIKYPTPKIFEFEGYASYGYEERVLFPFQIILPSRSDSDLLTVTVKIKSLICKDVCKPFNTELKEEFNINSSYNSPREIVELFGITNEQLPKQNDQFNFEVEENTDKILLKINSSKLNLVRVKYLHFIPYENGIFRNSLNQEFLRKENSLELSVDFDQFKTKVPDLLAGILIIEMSTEEGLKKVSYEINENLRKQIKQH